MKNESCIQQFLLAYQNRMAKGTLQIYQIGIWDLLNFTQTSFDQVTSRDIRKWILELEGKQYSPNTINWRIAGVQTFYRFCYEEDLIKQNPMTAINLLHIPDTLTYYLQLNQLSQLRKLVEHDREKRAMIEVLYTTGVRIGELVAMKKEDIDWTERFIQVPNGKRKKARIVCFTKECAEYLHVYLQNRTDNLPYVFLNTTNSGPVCIRTIQYNFEKYGNTLGFKLSPHTLRHTFAAHLAKKGMPLQSIQTLLGHESPQQTQMYARLYNEARKEIYDQWT